MTIHSGNIIVRPVGLNRDRRGADPHIVEIAAQVSSFTGLLPDLAHMAAAYAVRPAQAINAQLTWPADLIRKVLWADPSTFSQLNDAQLTEEEVRAALEEGGNAITEDALHSLFIEQNFYLAVANSSQRHRVHREDVNERIETLSDAFCWGKLLALLNTPLFTELPREAFTESCRNALEKMGQNTLDSNWYSNSSFELCKIRLEELTRP